MKKFLSILSILLAVCLCLASCNVGGKNEENAPTTTATTAPTENATDESTKTETPSDASKQAIIDMFAKCGDIESLFDDIMEAVEDEIDLDEVYNEIVKYNGEVSVDMNAIFEGESTSASGYLGYKNGDVAVKLAATSADFNTNATSYGFFTEDLLFVLVTVDDQGYIESEVMDFAEYLDVDDFIDGFEEAMDGSAAALIYDFKLPALSMSDIKFSDGKYVISKDYWKKTVEYTLDLYIDALKDSGAEIDGEEFNEIKDMAKTAIEEVDFEIFFRMSGADFVGFGVNAHMDANDLAKIDGENADEEFKSMDVEFDIKSNGKILEYVKFNMDVNHGEGHQQIDFRLDAINDGDTLAGFDITAYAHIESSFYSGSYDENDDYVGSYEVHEVTEVNANATLDLTKVDMAGQDVFKFDMSVVTKENNDVDVDVDMNAKITAKGNDKFEFSFNYVDAQYDDDNMSATGTIKFSENPVNFPEIPDDVIEAKNEALDDYAG